MEERNTYTYVSVTGTEVIGLMKQKINREASYNLSETRLTNDVVLYVLNLPHILFASFFLVQQYL
jgi:hypothetical protein